MKKIETAPALIMIRQCILYFEKNWEKVNCFPDIARELKTDTFRNAEEIAMKYYAGVNVPLKYFIAEFDKKSYEMPADFGKKVADFISYASSYMNSKAIDDYAKMLNDMVGTCQYLTGVFRAKNNELLANERFDHVAVIIKNSTLTIEFGLTDDNQVGILDEVVKNIQTRNKKSGKVLGNTYLIKLGL